MLSMTGYGKGVAATGNFELTVELKSVNNRYLDIGMKMPKQLASFESRLRDELKKNVLRGKISVFIELREVTGNQAAPLLDMDKIRLKYEALNAVRSALKIEEPVRIGHLVSFPELFESNYSALSEELLMTLVSQALSEALNDFNRMRKEEGDFLLEDMKQRLAMIETLTEDSLSTGKTMIRKEFDRLYNQVIELIGQQKLESGRLEQEIAIVADKVDITEECIRLKSHINLFRQTLAEGTDIGKKLNFILQEMLREANTINSKSTDIGIIHDVIKIKEEIEKLREQTQNIE